MRWRDIGHLALWHLHRATQRQLAGQIISMVDWGLDVHIFACRMSDGTPSVAILGVDEGGVSRAYAEVVLTDLDVPSRAAWTVLRADDVVHRAKAKLVEVDAILRGEAPPKRDTSWTS